MRIAVVNGPNLNLLGTREPEIYGTGTLADLERDLATVAIELGVEITFVQHNGEGGLVDAIQSLQGQSNGLILNAGAYSHTSLAIRDALAAVRIPFVEVHISNIFGREPERRHSQFADLARGIVCGLGTFGYELALRGLCNSLRTK